MTTFSVQASNLPLLKEALKSSCTGVRFGSEFCMYDLPTERSLVKVLRLANDAGKPLTYMTPRVSDDALEKISGHFKTLNDLGSIDIVVNDFGALHTLRDLPNLKPHLGRQLVYMPA
ncbi:hypothetical protein ISS96_02335, partial [Candidatus Bathyarchaeota archaeon]|nr:hypothetical protein [Candidatus Bathyarchaeota archaeon]